MCGHQLIRGADVCVMYLVYDNFSCTYPLHLFVVSQAVEQLNLADNLSSKCVEMLDEVLVMIKKLTGANVEHAALIANSKILTLFSRFVIVFIVHHYR